MVRAAGVLALALAFAEAAAFLPPRAHLAPAHQRAQVCQRSGVRGLRQQGDYSLSLKSPMGIVFEEVEPGERKGVAVASLKPLGNAAADARILVGDKLISVSAAVMDKSNAPLFQLGGGASSTSWKREMIPCGLWDFESVMRAIGSNNGRWGYTDVRMTLRRTDKSIPRARQQAVEDVPEAPQGTVMDKPKDSWD